MFLEHVYEISSAKHDRWFQGYWTKNIEEPALEDPRHASARIAWLQQRLEQSFRDGESDRAGCDLPQNATHLSHWIHWSPYLTISHHMSPCLRVFQEMPRAKSIQELHCFWILVPSFAQLDKCVSWEVRSLHFIPTQSSRLNKNMNQSDTAIHVCSVMRGMNPRQKAVKKRFWLI